jgi:Na+/H+ antiporter NhaD/arsenite permease-like protein
MNQRGRAVFRHIRIWCRAGGTRASGAHWPMVRQQGLVFSLLHHVTTASGGRRRRYTAARAMAVFSQWTIISAWAVFFIAYAALAIGYVPVLRLDRTGAAFVGAVAFVFVGVLSSHEAFLAQDYETLVLLFSMMLIVSFLVNSGILGRLDRLLRRLVTGRRALLWTVVAASGLFSAFFINDVVCLVLTPIVISLARHRRWNPVPFLLAVAMASNIGSVMTPVGNPQNIFIAAASKISYARFVTALAPVSLVGLVILGLYLEWSFRGRWEGAGEPVAEPALPAAQPPPIQAYVLWRTVAVLGAVLVAFWVGLPMAQVAAAGAALLLLTRRTTRRAVFALVDWDLLVLFISLFVLTAGARKVGIIETIYGQMTVLRPDHFLSFSALTLLLSNVVSNVPAVFFLGQVIPGLPRPESSWLLTAMVSTLAGNLTLIGSIANLIVVEKARSKVSIDFWTYTRVGLPVTALTLAAGLGYWWLVGL